MPDLDGGHYFLTVLAPIRADSEVEPTTGASRSPRHLLAQALALLPTGQQTSESPLDAEPSPFARNALNHLARFAIVDGPAYNGRVSGDTIVGKALGIDPLTPQPVDRLNAPYLLFAADVDARGDGESGLRAYTDALWTTMERELRSVFGHCLGFAGVEDAGAFHAYVKRCQVETTMPFNDYWADGLVAQGLGRRLYAPLAVAGIALAAFIATIAILAFSDLLSALGAWRYVIPLVEAALVPLALFAAYKRVMDNGAKPFPTAECSDLPSVLKALYLQQRFARFAIEAQGLDDGALHARFAAFLAASVPDAAQPTQGPGQVFSPATVAAT